MKCQTKYCRKQAAPSRKVCLACNSRLFRERHPMKYCYLALKHNAKRRKKEFTISFEYFQQFCYETNYIAGKGRSKLSYSIDRIDETKGYVPGNIQVLPVGVNKQKHLHYEYQTKSARITTEVKDRRKSDEWDTGLDAESEW